MKRQKAIAKTSSFKNEYDQRRRLEMNKAVSAFYTRRNHLERELKEVNSALLKLLGQLQIDEEYKSQSRFT